MAFPAPPYSLPFNPVQGIFFGPRRPINGAYTIVPSDFCIAINQLAATYAVTLPSAASVRNQYFIVKDETGNAGTNNVTFVGTIDGATNKSIATAYGVLRFYSNGTAYYTF